jgi:hypothetical protein
MDITPGTRGTWKHPSFTGSLTGTVTAAPWGTGFTPDFCDNRAAAPEEQRQCLAALEAEGTEPAELFLEDEETGAPFFTPE